MHSFNTEPMENAMKKTYFLIPGMISMLMTTAHPSLLANEYNPSSSAQKHLQQIHAENQQHRDEIKSRRRLELEAVQNQRSAFRTELAQLKGQKKSAIQSGNVDQAKAIQLQIKNLKTKNRDEAKLARAQFKEDRQKFHEAKKARREQIKALKQEEAKS